MDWALESSQPLVMLLLDFEKAYDRVEWSLLEGTLSTIGFNQQWIEWVWALYIDSWSKVGVNNIHSPTFKLTRSIRHGCPLAPFLFLFIVDSLGYLLENQGIEGLRLLETNASVIDYEFANDTNLYLASNLDNLNKAKTTLELFAIASGSKIN